MAYVSWKTMVYLKILKVKVLCKFNESNFKVIYNTIKKLSGDMQQKIFPSEYTAKGLVELFSKHFFDKIVTLRSLITSKSDESHLTENKVECSVKFEQMDSFLPVSIKKLQYFISSMNNMSSLLDPAPISLIKECFDTNFSHFTVNS